MALNKLYTYFIADHHRSDEYIFYRYKLLLHTSFLTSIFSLQYLIVSLTIDFDPGVYLMIFNVVGFLLLPFLMKTRIPIIRIGNLYVLIGTFAVVLIIFFSGGVDSPVMPWLIAPPVLALLIVGRNYALLWAGISLLCLATFFLFAVIGKVCPVEYNEEWKMFFMILSSSGIILIALVISMVFESNTVNALHAVETQKRELELSKEELAIRHNEILEKNEILASQRQELLTTSDQLKELNEKKDYLMEVLAHDLKSPLASTQFMISLIKKDAFNPESMEFKVLDMIAESSGKSLTLIQKILNSENLESILYNLRPESVNISQVLENIVNEMMPGAAQKGIIINLEIKNSDSLMLWVDKIYLTQIFENLLSNAVKFSPLNKSILITVLGNENFIRVEVKDEGPGISASEMEMLFSKFRKLSNKPTAGESSTGLGLFIVKHYTELLEGNVWCESNADIGCNFIVELPVRYTD